MTATNHTEHYGLSQYVQDDHPTYTGDYNGDMSKIDAASLTGGTDGLTAVAHGVPYRRIGVSGVGAHPRRDPGRHDSYRYAIGPARSGRL